MTEVLREDTSARRKIIEAAREVFVDPGYAAATIKQLAAAAGVSAALGAPHPLGQLRIQVHHGRLILERTADILLALRAAASADEDAARLWQTNLAQRRTVQQHLMIG